MVNRKFKQYLSTIHNTYVVKKKIKKVFILFSIIVTIAVFWNLKLTGITLAGDAFCGKEEHEHSKDCYETSLICEEHSHSDECYVFDLICDSEHDHVAECYNVLLICGYEHTHVEACYQKSLVCIDEEHIHDLSCYSDISADVETHTEWEATFSHVDKDMGTSEKLIEIAKSQIGYRESEKNYIVDQDTKFYYTRYGEWYGNPYGKWATMFTSFCIRYAGIDDISIHAGAETMMLDWKEKGYYQSKHLYQPNASDILFIDSDENGSIDTTAIIIETSVDRLKVIQGDVNHTVAEIEYDITSNQIVGYGVVLPQKKVMNIEVSNPITEDEPQDEIMMISPGVLLSNKNYSYVGKTVNYDQSLFTGTNRFLLYTTINDKHYAFDGNGNAVEILIDDIGSVSAAVDNRDLLLWRFESAGTDTYYIQNVSTGKYMHSYAQGVTTTGKYSSVLISNGSGVNVKSNNEFAYLNTSNMQFVMTQNQWTAAVYNFAMVKDCSVWMDGTNGGLMALGGSDDIRYSSEVGRKIKLPTEWKSPEKYEYQLNGWYDVINHRYYAPGEDVVVTGDMVFYADWVAKSYDIGQYNNSVADTVDTSDFITTRVFDYSMLFNVLSSNVSVQVDEQGHSETWSLVQGGNVPYKNSETLNFVFRDWDQGYVDISYPNNINDQNNYIGGIVSNIYRNQLGNVLFDSDTSFDSSNKSGIIGKHYLGKGNYLFQLMDDPNHPNYGYYYYDSKLNAASYNQSEQRFYVYDYLECTSESLNTNADGSRTDFLPLNSPYANTNGKSVKTYTYNGENNEYAGVTHYSYDARYNTDGSTTSNVSSNFFFGMAIDINFYLPNTPGYRDSEGNYGNQDLYGKDMHFKFSGDDDVWVFLDGNLVLDIGGIHGIESGDINFATGVVTINGNQVGTLNGVASGEHKLTIYYLERGSSQSNCAIYFNLAPRFQLKIQKEDAITQEILNGTEFSVYTDRMCTIPAELWDSQAAHDRGEASKNTFEVVDGSASIWGFSAGNTYYIKETKPPDSAKYTLPKGIISMTLDKSGFAYYHVFVLDEINQNGSVTESSVGFDVTGFKIDEENQQAYIVVTNISKDMTGETQIQAIKEWNDLKDHSEDSVTIYLTVTDSNGTVRRLREAILSEENDWHYIWTKLPKYYEDGVTEIKYGVEESYKSGYYSTVSTLNQIETETYAWETAYYFENNGVYLLKTSEGYLSAESESSDKFRFVDEATAKISPLAQWKTTGYGNTYTFTNLMNQTISFVPNNDYSYFIINAYNGHNTMHIEAISNGVRLYNYTAYNRNYYMGNMNSNGTMAHTQWYEGGIAVQLMKRVTKQITTNVEGVAFKITNTPLEQETSLKVIKDWYVGSGNETLYQQLQVTVKLLANGKDTGRTITLNSKNNWTATFSGLPYVDNNNNIISYTIEESWDTDDWIFEYGDIIAVEGKTITYETVLTNIYKWGNGYELPSTGGSGPIIWVIIGGTLISISVIGFILLLKENRKKG